MEQNEFERRINIEELVSTKQGKVDITATQEECDALAERFEYELIENVRFFGTVTKNENDTTYTFNGKLNATVRPFDDDDTIAEKIELDEEIEILLSDTIDEDDEELEGDIELIEDGFVDFGEIAAQYICILSDPFGSLESLEALFDMVENEEVPENERKQNPFTELRALLEQEMKEKK